MRYTEAKVASFIDRANDTGRTWSKNGGLVWEDGTAENINRAQEKSGALWERRSPISEFILRQVGRLDQRIVIDHVDDWRKKLTVGPVPAELPT